MENVRKGMEAMGHAVYGVSSSGNEEVEQYRFDHQLAYPFLVGDEKVLKTVVRSNPGFVLIKDGSVVKKWHNNDLSDWDEVEELIKQN